jgi:branched-chain amino acid transport system ATP-binding protein
MTIVAAREIEVSYYGDILVLQGVSVEVEEGKITIVIGPNGAGKSTLLKTLYGLLTPRRGRILYRGEDITGMKVHHFLSKGLAYVPQARSIFPELTVRENLLLGCWIMRRDGKAVQEALEYVFSFFPMLREKQRAKAGTLSGGQQKILEVARGLLTHPEVFLLDEPTATLAPIVAKEIYAFLENLRAHKTTVVLVDQNVKQAFEISDYVYILELGRNRAQGPKAMFQGKLREVIQDWLDYEIPGG